LGLWEWRGLERAQELLELELELELRVLQQGLD
jgi:hypothetical protein